MIQTHRRRNLCEAYLLVDRPWATMEQLQSAGAYGSRQSIHRAMRKLMLKEEAVIIASFKTSEGPVLPQYKFTNTGLTKMGRIPAKRDNDAHEEHPEC